MTESRRGMDVEAMEDKLRDLSERAAKVKNQRAEILGSLNAKKEELAALVREMKAAGYNPQTINQQYSSKKQELEESLASYELQLVQAERAIEEFYRK